MIWIRLTALGTAITLSSLTASPSDPPFSAMAEGTVAAKLPPVLRPLETPDTRHVSLPGPPRVTPALKLIKPIAPMAKMAPIPSKLIPDPTLRQPVLPPAAPVAVSAAPSAPGLPAEIQREVAVFCQKQIGHWRQPEARKTLGEPTRHRPAYDEKQAVNGTIYAFADPSGRYRELELDFDRETGTLRSVFVYPLRLTWQECRKLWDGPVSAADANQGRKFYSYSNRRLDVLVDPSGKVISLGWY
jgi:hypothetical protein